MGLKNAETQVSEEKKMPPPSYEDLSPSGLFGTRHFVTFMLFLGMANAYIMRTNMSVAIVAMVNHTAIGVNSHSTTDEGVDSECGVIVDNTTTSSSSETDGEFVWETDVQGYVLSSFFYGYVVTQIPFGILAKKYGNIYFLGVGMLINSVFGLLVPVAAHMGIWWLIAVRFIQGLGEGPIVPCTHALLAKWIPPNERSRMGAFVYAGAQFGTVISMPLSGLIYVTHYEHPLIFYVFGALGAQFGTVISMPLSGLIYVTHYEHPLIFYVFGALGAQFGTVISMPLSGLIYVTHYEHPLIFYVFGALGAQFGTVISMPLSGLLSVTHYGWPSIFYVFGALGTVWCVAFLIWVYEDPEANPRINPDERMYIQKTLGRVSGQSIPPIPWTSIVKSLPFWAILLAHMGHNYGYETLMTELPTYMKQVLHFSIKDNGFLSALPYLAMWLFSIFISHIADWMLTKPYITITIVRKIINGIGQYGPAVALFAAAFTGCDRWLTVSLLTIGVGLNGGIYSGFKVNHLDISPQFAGILMSFTNCLANLAGLLAPIYAGIMVKGTPSIAKWRTVFITAAGVYAACCTFYVFFSSGQRQVWDQPQSDKKKKEPNQNEEPTFVTTQA